MREEVKAHARALNCNYVLAYTETLDVREEGLCILSASGTAVTLRKLRTRKSPCVSTDVNVTTTANSEVVIEPSSSSSSSTPEKGTSPSSPRNATQTAGTSRSRKRKEGRISHASAESSPSKRPLRTKKKKPSKRRNKCSYFHLPYDSNATPFPMTPKLCQVQRNLSHAFCRPRSYFTILLA